jgi:hypothetical protein
MKLLNYASAGLSLLLGGSLALHAQNYSLNSPAINAGGGTFSGGTFSLTANIGQPANPSAASGGSFTMNAGPATLLANVVTPGMPTVTIKLVSHNIILSWPVTAAGFALEQTASLKTPNWTTTAGTVTVVNGQNQLVITTPTGNNYFRLVHQ